MEVGGVLVTGIHANSYTVNRRDLWKDLYEISLLDKPWLLIGDFNTVLNADEKKGGRSPLNAAMSDFNDCIDACGLIQAPKSGLDPAARGISDHGPLIGSDILIGRALNTPFKFQQMWLTHPSFLQVVVDSWNEDITSNYEIAANNYNTFLRDKARMNWIKDGDGISEILIDYFKKKCEYHTVQINDSILDVVPHLISEDDNLYLEECPNEEKIKRVVFNLNAGSAPGPDGFTGTFYRAVWEIFKGNLLEAIQFCWRNNIIPSGMNSNFLVLIPKIKGAKTAKIFRPIGLSNFCFKIITKIITERITSYLPNLVSQQQYAFVKNRNINEQILLASELVNEISTIRRGGNVDLKLDISQAYDTMSWEFLYRALKKLEDSSISYGKKNSANGDKKWYLSYSLMFADDIFLFCNGGKKSIEHLKTLLMEYQAASGQIFNALLASWSGKILNFQARLTLVNHVLSSIPIYNLSIYKWPRKVLEACEKIIRNYLWSGNAEERKCITLKWDNVCTSKEEGGLGIRKLEDVNKALLMKVLWKILNFQDEWAKFFLAKYMDKNGKWITFYRKSSVWNGIRCVLPDFIENTIRIVGNGAKVSLWNDRWIFEEPICKLFPNHPYIALHPHLKVQDLIVDNHWCFHEDFLQFFTIDQLPILEEGEDLLIWSNSHSGVFTVLMLSIKLNCTDLNYIGIKRSGILQRYLQPLQICGRLLEIGNPGNAGYGFVVRNRVGAFIFAKSGGLGITTNYVAEFISCIRALEWAVEQQSFQLILQSDSSMCAKALQEQQIPWFLLARWKRIMVSIHSITFRHAYREINFSADHFAKKGTHLRKGQIMSFNERPSNFLRLESPGKPYYRFF
ncbi:uncharacterized protein LOC113351651 [Papaver somniferum]|uniref:uncharacterized protein LOC113351651 n=1 Tax=Papaver somniferum TaxID=3469 RepID=UPI000E6F4D0B|nr:uncharacterized protein LOC113351651 [Papaver somniferum]